VGLRSRPGRDRVANDVHDGNNANAAGDAREHWQPTNTSGSQYAPNLTRTARFVQATA